MKVTAIRVLLAGIGVPAVVAGAAGLLQSAWKHRLPDPIATHWGPDGVDGSLPLNGFATGAFSACAVLAVAGTAFTLGVLRRGRGLRRGVPAFWAWLAALPPATLIASMWASLDAPRWQEASGPLLPVLTLLGISVGAAGAAAVAAGPGRPPSHTGDVPKGPSSGLRPGRHAVWVSGSTSGGLAAACLLLPAGVLVVTDLATPGRLPWPPYAIGLVVGILAGAAVSRLRVVADGTGVTIRMGILGYPRKHVPLADILSATVERLGLWSKGGLGIRMNPVTGDTAYKIRGGPALVLHLRNGYRLFVVADRPQQGAALLNDLIEAVPGERGPSDTNSG